MKKCCYCKELKLESEFNKHKSRKDGLQSRCKPCDRKRALEYFNKNRELQIPIRAENKKLRKIRNRNFILDYLNKNPCVDCGNSDVRVLEFDHINPKDKKYEVSNLVNMAYNLDTVRKEIEKCEIRCANCHKIRTMEQFKYYSYME